MQVTVSRLLTQLLIVQTFLVFPCAAFAGGNWRIPSSKVIHSDLDRACLILDALEDAMNEPGAYNLDVISGLAPNGDKESWTDLIRRQALALSGGGPTDTGAIALRLDFSPNAMSRSNDTLRLHVFTECGYGQMLIRDSMVLRIGEQSGRCSSAVYWAALVRGTNTDSIVVYGEGVMRGPLQTDSLLRVTAHYYDVQPNPYLVRVFRCQSMEHVGKPDWADAQGLMDNTVNVLAFASDTTCFADYCSDGHFYVQAERHADEALLVKAKIRTEYGTLCGEPHQTESATAHSCAYVAIMALTETGRVISAECGYRRYREAGWNGYGCFGALTRPDGRQQNFALSNVPVPAPGSSHQYKLYLDPSTGRWYFYVDNEEKAVTEPYSEWIGTVGTHVAWSAEIRGYETDMPGTSSEKCLFEYCQYGTSEANWRSASLYDADSLLNSDDTAQWKHTRIDDMTFQVWDVVPLPPVVEPVGQPNVVTAGGIE